MTVVKLAGISNLCMTNSPLVPHMMFTSPTAALVRAISSSRHGNACGILNKGDNHPVAIFCHDSVRVEVNAGFLIIFKHECNERSLVIGDPFFIFSR